MGTLIFGIGALASGAVWILTTVIFFQTGETFLALLSLLVPPAEVVLPFLISWQLGVAGLASTAVMLLGVALKRD